MAADNPFAPENFPEPKAAAPAGGASANPFHPDNFAAADAKIDPTAPTGDTGFLGGLADLGRGLAHGAISTVPKSLGEAAQFFGATETGDKLVAIGKANEDAFPQLKQSQTGQVASEDWTSLRGAAYAAGDSTPLSMGGGLAGAAVGGAIGAAAGGVGALPGAAAGYIIGSLASLPIFYGSQAQQSYEKVRDAQMKAGAAPEAAESAARKAGHLSGAIEAGGELAADLIPFHALAKPFVKPAAGAAVKSMLSGGLKRAAATVGGTIASEVATEMGQQAGEAQVEHAFGAGEGATWKDTASVILPTALMSLLPGGFAAAHNFRTTLNIRHSLVNPEQDPERRAAAAGVVFHEIAPYAPDVAEAFDRYAAAQIADEKPIEIGNDAVYLAWSEARRPPSERMGLDPNAGPMSAAAASAVDSGLSEAVNAQRADEALQGMAEQAGKDLDGQRQFDRQPSTASPMSDSAVANQLADAAAAESEAGVPLLPLKSEKEARSRAALWTERTGNEHVAVPHPLRSDRWSVVPRDSSTAVNVYGPVEEQADAETTQQPAGPAAEAAAPALAAGEDQLGNQEDAAGADQGAPANLARAGVIGTDNIASFGHGAADAITANLYGGLFKALQEGKTRMAGVKDPVLAKSKAAFDAGEITSPEQLRAFIAGGYQRPNAEKEAQESGTNVQQPVAPPAPTEPVTVSGKDLTGAKTVPQAPAREGEFIGKGDTLPPATILNGADLFPSEAAVRAEISKRGLRADDYDIKAEHANGWLAHRRMAGQPPQDFALPKGRTLQGEAKAEAPAAPALPAVKPQLFVERGGKRFAVDSLEDASAKWSQFRDASGAGVSVLGSDAKIVDQNGTEVARISYNGKVWPPGEYRPGMKPLVGEEFKPSSAPLKGEFIPAGGGSPYERGKAAADAVQPRDAPPKDLTKEQRAEWHRGYDEVMLPRIPPRDAGEGPAITVDAGAHQAASSPKNDKPEASKAQILGGNAELGHFKIGPLDITIENPEGSTRRDLHNTPPKWERTMARAHYGYVKGTVAADSTSTKKQGIDVFVKPGTAADHAGPVFVIDQRNAAGKFDEHKVMIGYPSKVEAIGAYKANYQKGWKVGPVHQTTMDEFNMWARSRDTKRPFADRTVEKMASLYGKEAIPPVTVERGDRKFTIGSEWDFPPDSYREIYNEPGGIVALRITDESGETVAARRGLIYKGDLTAEHVSDVAGKILDDEEAKKSKAKNPTTPPVPVTAGIAPQGAAAKVRPPRKPRAKVYPQWAHELDLRDGDIVTLSKRIDYADVDKQDRIEIDPNAMWVEDIKTGGRTSLHKWQVQKAIKDGTMTVDRSGRAATATVPPSQKHEAAAPTAVVDPFAKNTIFTADAVAAARARIKSKLGTLKSGIDPELMQDGITIAGAYVEAGVRGFAEFSAQMVSDLGEAIRPYLRTFYEGVRHWPGLDTKGMTPAAEIDGLTEPKTAPKVQEAEATNGERTTPDAGEGHGPADDAGSGAGDVQPARAKRKAGGRAQSASGDLFGDSGGEPQPGGAGRSDTAAPAPVRGEGGAAGTGETGSGGSGADGGAGIPARRKLPRGVADYRPAPGELTRSGSWRDAAARNLDILELVHKLESEGRYATREEQALLARFTGWGASELRQNLFVTRQDYETKKPVLEPNYARDGWKPLVERAFELMTPEELDTALTSTQYAHYTSEAVVRSIWSGMERFGFTGGRILEPGMGTGVFATLAPKSVMAHSVYTGIEREKLTAAIAKQLLPAQNVLNADYIHQKLPNGYFDVAIGNPPFARTKILSDPDYKRLNFSLHDYFFAKTLDKVRPGGLLVFVTSRYTMDKAGDRARTYMAERADLFGAIRLPQTAFKQNAGTEVVTDVLFFRKRAPGEEAAGAPFLKLDTVDTPEGPTQVNEYFAQHPEMVLGTHSLTGTMRHGSAEYTVLPAEGDIAEQFAAAIAHLPEKIYQKPVRTATERKTFERDLNPKVQKEGGIYVADDGNLYRREFGAGRRLEEFKNLPPAKQAWLKSYIALRDLMKQARYDQIRDADWETSLKALNKAHDAFVKEHGYLLAYTERDRVEVDADGQERSITVRTLKNSSLFGLDVEGPLVQALEDIDSAGVIVKGSFLKGRSLRRPAAPKIESTHDALLVSLSDRGRLDLPHIAALRNADVDGVIKELGEAIYRNPAGDWETADEYLSGNVVTKLAEARIAAESDPQYERNVAALYKAQPAPLTTKDVTVGLGSPWLPSEDIDKFAQEIIGINVGTEFNGTLGQWNVPGASMTSYRSNTNEWGTPRRSPYEILEAALNNRTFVIRDTVDEKQVVNPEASAAANDKARQLREAFKRWVWTDSERAGRLLDEYNRRFNNLAPRTFDGSFLRLPGLSLRWQQSMHPHQKRAIWRQIQTGNVYLAHAVGAGKTMEMIVGGMEQRRLGLIQKPIYVVPNHMLNQFANEFLDAYPGADIMVADEQNFHTSRRRQFVAAAATNNPDAIIITHSAFQKIAPPKEATAKVLDRLVDELRSVLDDLEKDDRRTRSQIEARIEQIEERFGARTSGENTDDVVDLKDMGVDYMYVDEAHEYRKLDFVTNLNNVKGITPVGSQKALDLYIKVKALEEINPGRSHTFGSGTAITNTLGELYTLQRFMDEDELQGMGLGAFDSWASQFGEVAKFDERNAAGKYEVVERFARFVNIPELMSRIRQFMDVLTTSQLGDLVHRPAIVGGQPQVLVSKPSAGLNGYMRDLDARIKISRAWKPSKEQPGNPDPLINIITDGRLSAIDLRFVTGGRNDPNSKLNKMVDTIITKHREHKDAAYVDPKTGKTDVIRGAAQIVFSAVGFGEAVAANRGFDVRSFIMGRLKAGGISANQVAWMSDYDTHAKKEAMFRDMREGKVKILFGSPKNMGTGLNVQRRLAVLHYLAPPWYPSDVEQPHGRILRQGNLNKNIELLWYATEGTYDSTQWQMIARKARFIEQAMTGDNSVRKLDDISESSLYEQASALASGDARVIEYSRLVRDIESLETLERAHAQEQIGFQRERDHLLYSIRSDQAQITAYTAAVAAGGGTYVSSRQSRATIKGRAFDGYADIGAAIYAEGQRLAVAWEPTRKNEKASIPIGTIGDGEHAFPVSIDLAVYGTEKKPEISVRLATKIGPVENTDASSLDFSEALTPPAATAIATRAFNGIQRVESTLSDYQDRVKSNTAEVERVKRRIGTAFPRAQELVDAIARAAQLRSELLATDSAIPQDTLQELAASRWEDEGGRVPPAEESTAPEPKLKAGPLAGGGATTTQVRGWILPLLRSWPGAPKIHVVQSVDRLPFYTTSERIKNAFAIGGAVRGAYWEGDVYLVADNIRNANDAQFVLLHETAGHYGLKGVLGDQLAPMLQRIYRTNANVREFADEKMAQLGYDQDLATEEALSDMAGANQVHLISGWRLLVAAIRNALRKAGFTLDMSDNDVAALLTQSRRFVENPSTAAGVARARARAAILATTNPTFYSQLTAAIGKAPFAKDGTIGVGQLRTWLAARARDGTFKSDELEWSGLGDWLAMQQGKVSREAVQEYLRENGVRVEETVLGDDLHAERVRAARGRLEAAGYSLWEDGYHWLLNDQNDDQVTEDDLPPDLAADYLLISSDPIGEADERGTKFSGYQLPGGENYRELLLTLPERQYEYPDITVVRVGNWWPNSDMDGKWRVTVGGKDRGFIRAADEHEARWKASQEARSAVEDKQNFRSSHFDQPNILAHVRFNERTDAQGKRVLFIEELQSDFAQQGRKRGFDLTPKERARLAELDAKPNMTPAEVEESMGLTARKGSGIPAAPFVGKTEAWVALAMKRMIRYAAENGYDRVALTNGEQQADRYDLSKQVGSIKATRLTALASADAEYHIEARTPDGSRITDRKYYERELPDVVGKEMAEKIRADTWSKAGSTKTYSGLDLKVGGEGMKGFYDQIVPSVTNDVLKRLGGGRVSEIDLTRPGPPMHSTNAGAFIGKQPGFDITPALLERAMQGVPLFSRVYHGTTRDVRNYRIGTNKFGDEDLGIHFGSAAAASRRLEDARAERRQGAPRIYMEDITLRNPLRLPDVGNWKSASRVAKVAEAAGIPGLVAGLKRISGEREQMPWLRQQIRAAGYDGVVYENSYEGGGESIIVFEPPARAATDARLSIDAGALTRRATDLAGDLFRSVNQFNPVLKHFQTQYHKAQRNPHFRGVFDAAQHYIQDVSRFANEAADLAPDLLPRLKSLRDVLPEKLGGAPIANEADSKAVGRAMFAATLADVRPSLADLRAGMSLAIEGPDGTRSVDVPPLTERQIGIYEQARAAIDLSLDQMTVSELTKLARGENVAAAIAQAQADPANGAAAIIEAIRGVAAGLVVTQPNEAARLQNLAAQMADFAMETDALKERGYAPLMRFGRYTVDVTETIDGEPVRRYFSLFESKTAAFAAERQMREVYPDATVTVGTMDAEQWQLYQGLSLDSLAAFARTTGLDQGELFQEFYKIAVSTRSALKRLIHRKGIAGYDEDLSRVLASFVTSNARLASKNIHFAEMTHAAAMIPKQYGDVQAEARKLVQYVQNPTEEAQALRGLLFVNFIGGSIASALTNATQPFMMTAPYLSQFSNPFAAGKALAQALAVRSETAGPTLAAALARAEKEGITDPQELHQLYAESIRTLGTSRPVRKALRIWGAPFAAAEAFNRRLTFIAAYQMASEDLAGINAVRERQGRQPFLTAFDFAADAVVETQGLYNRANRPNAARGAIGGTIFTFKQFSIAYLEFLSRLPAREKAVALSLLLLAAGLQGAPGADNLEDLIDTIGQMLGYNTNSRKALREGAARVLGDTLGGLLTHGVSGVPGVPLDVQGRLGINNLIPGTALFKRSETDKTAQLMEFLGPVGGLYSNAQRAVGAAQAGSLGAAAGALAPTAIANAMKGIDMWTSGQYSDSKGRKVISTDGTDAALKFIGIQPADVAVASRKAQDVRQDIAMVRTVEAGIADKWARGVLDRDPKAVAAALDELRTWNRDNPDSIIRINAAQIQQRVRQAQLERGVRLAKTAPVEQRGQVSQALH